MTFFVSHVSFFLLKRRAVQITLIISAKDVMLGICLFVCLPVCLPVNL